MSILWHNNIAKSYGTKRLSYSRFKAIVIHYTGNEKDTAENNAKYFASKELPTGAHIFVDSKGVWKSTPIEYASWSVGKLYDKKYSKYWGILNNYNTLNIEIADDGGNYKPSQKAINNAIEITKYYMNKYHINLVVRHKDVCGKNCPAFWWDDSLWETEFLCKVKSFSKFIPQSNSKKDNDTYYNETGIYRLLKEINLHENKLMSSRVLQVLKKGDAYTVIKVEIKEDGSKSGKLKSGAGYITLNKQYVEKVK